MLLHRNSHPSSVLLPLRSVGSTSQPRYWIPRVHPKKVALYDYVPRGVRGHSIYRLGLSIRRSTSSSGNSGEERSFMFRARRRMENGSSSHPLQHPPITHMELRPRLPTRMRTHFPAHHRRHRHRRLHHPRVTTSAYPAIHQLLFLFNYTVFRSLHRRHQTVIQSSHSSAIYMDRVVRQRPSLSRTGDVSVLAWMVAFGFGTWRWGLESK